MPAFCNALTNRLTLSCVSGNDSMAGIGVMVGVDRTGVKVIVAVETGVFVGVELDAGAQETRTIARMTVSNVFVFIF